MKRFASHYLFLPSYGFLKQYIVEVNNAGYAMALYPLKEEIESIVWTSGVIALIHLYNSPHLIKEQKTFQPTDILQDLPVEFRKDLGPDQYTPIRLYPFDFQKMQPTSDTVFQVLDHYIF